MVTTIELCNGTVLKVQESVDEVNAKLDAAGAGEAVYFSSVSGTRAVANRTAVVDVRGERF